LCMHTPRSPPALVLIFGLSKAECVCLVEDEKP
jgi:hypothetical protein